MIQNLVSFYLSLINHLNATAFSLDGYSVTLWQIIFIPLALGLAIDIVIRIQRGRD